MALTVLKKKNWLMLDGKVQFNNHRSSQNMLHCKSWHSSNFLPKMLTISWKNGIGDSWYKILGPYGTNGIKKKKEC